MIQHLCTHFHRQYTQCNVYISLRLRDSSPVRGIGRMGGAAMRGSSEDLLSIRSRGYRGSLPYKKFSPVSIRVV